MKVEVQYDKPKYTIVNEVRLLKLENIISNKINRLLLKDLYDLSYLLKLSYNINEIQIYSEKEIKENYKNCIYKGVNLTETIETIKEIRKKKGVRNES